MNKRIDIVFLLLILPGLTFGQNNANVSVGHNQSKSFGHLVEEDLGQALTVNVNPLQSSFNTTKTRVPSPGGRVWVYNSDPGENKSNHILFHSEEAVQSTTDGLKTYNPGFTGEFLVTSTTSSEKSAPTWAVSGEFEEQLDFEIKVVPDDDFSPDDPLQRKRSYSKLGVGETGLISCQITKPQTKKLPSGASIEITSNNDILELYPKGNLSCDFIAKGIQDDGQTINNQVVVLVTVNVKDKNGCLLRSKNICIVILEPTGLVFTLINRRNNTEQEKFLNEYIKLGGPFPNIYPSYRNKAQILGYPVIGRYGASFFASISLTPQDVSFNNLNIFENSCSSLVSGCFTGHNLNHPRTPESNYFTISSIQSGNTITGDIGITGDFVLIAMADYEYKEKYDINKKTGKFLWNIPCLYKTQHDSFAATYLIIEQKGEFKVNNQGYIETSTTKESSATRVLPPPPNNL